MTDDHIVEQLSRWADDLASHVAPHRPDLRPHQARRRLLAPLLAGALVAAALAAVVFVQPRSMGDGRTGSSAESTSASDSAPSTSSGALPSTSASASTPTSVLSTTATMELSPGAWASARTTPDGRKVLLQFIGAAPFMEGDPCTAEYSATAEETVEQVTVELSGVRPGGDYSCPAIGYLRSLTLDLAQPLGDRRMLALGQVRDVYDGADLARVEWMPALWSLREEGSAGVSGWYRTWSPDRPDAQSSCSPSAPGLTLFQQPADATDPRQPEPGAERVAEYDVNGTVAVMMTIPGRNVSTLAWTVDNRSFELRTAQVCDGDPDVDVDTFLTIARSVRPASAVEVSSGLLTLSIDNQSSAESRIDIEVTIDGLDVVSDEFTWTGGHDPTEYELPLTVGRHDIAITTSTGVVRRASFEIPTNGQLWALINYWYAPVGATSSGTDRSIEFRTDTERILLD